MSTKETTRNYSRGKTILPTQYWQSRGMELLPDEETFTSSVDVPDKGVRKGEGTAMEILGMAQTVPVTKTNSV